MTVGILCTALLGILLFGLGLYISILRQRTHCLVGHDSDPTDILHRAVRAHRNTAEYAPFLGLLFLWFATHPAPAWVSIVVVVATIARFLLVAGLLWGASLDKPNAARFLGGLLTYACGLALVVRLAVA